MFDSILVLQIFVDFDFDFKRRNFFENREFGNGFCHFGVKKLKSGSQFKPNFLRLEVGSSSGSSTGSGSAVIRTCGLGPTAARSGPKTKFRNDFGRFSSTKIEFWMRFLSFWRQFVFFFDRSHHVGRLRCDLYVSQRQSRRGSRGKLAVVLRSAWLKIWRGEMM